MPVDWERNIPEQTFHRWKRQFGRMEVSEAKRLRGLERENLELKMPVESLLKNRVLEAVCCKMACPAQKRDVAKEVVRAHPGHAPRARVDVGLHCRCHRAWRSLPDADDPG
jgi:hypothetical protein